ncbi:MAG: hypothetical protein ABW061_18925 [Polyangiaceae bacterium]
MSRCGSAWRLRGLLVLLSGCGARTALDSSDYGPSAAGTSSAGSAGVGPLIDPAVCSRFAPLWDSRAAATTLVCDTCLRDGGCDWPADDVCVSGTQCVDRRCSVLGDLTTLCSCIEGCFPGKLSVCDARWSKFMSCATTVCKSACP